MSFLSSKYGIRIYLRGTILRDHVDREGLVVSGILHIDQQVDEPWALEIEDNQLDRHEIFLKPGEMLLYEGSRLKHGRPKPLNGVSSSNLFVHFKPAQRGVES